jgi:hypothetical protein
MNLHFHWKETDYINDKSYYFQQTNFKPSDNYNSLYYLALWRHNANYIMPHMTVSVL